MSDRRAEALAAVRALGERVRPLSMAGERLVPVHPLLGELFPEGGLRRGSVVGCDGTASWSLAVALAAEASRAGSWVGVVGLPQFGVAAAADWGLALERVFLVAAPPADQLSTILAAVADGADVVIASVAAVRAGDARRLAARLTTRGGVLLAVGGPGGFTPDVVCRTVTTGWEGLGQGSGRLTARKVRVSASGRRAERPRQVELWFPGPQGQPAPVVGPGVRPEVGPVVAGPVLEREPLVIARAG